MTTTANSAPPPCNTASIASTPTATSPLTRQPVATLSRRETFSSAHRLHSKHLSAEENALVFGKCNHVHYHGHNYILQVDVRGPIDTRTGMVVNAVDLKKCIHEHVLSLLDHRNLDLDVSYFSNGVPSTTENLAVFIYRTLTNALPHYVGLTGDGVSRPRLCKVTLWETEKNKVEYWE